VWYFENKEHLGTVYVPNRGIHDMRAVWIKFILILPFKELSMLYPYVKEQRGSCQLHLLVGPSFIEMSATAAFLSAAELNRRGIHINVRKE